MLVRFFVLAAAIWLLFIDNVCAEDLNPVVGKAGDYVIREADLDRILSTQPLDTQNILKSNIEQRSNFIRQILLTKATSSKARKEGFDKKPEIRELLSTLIDNYLAQEYLNKVVMTNVSVTDEELKKYYIEHEKDFQIPVAVKVRHIFISSPKDSAIELKEKAKLKVEGILLRIRKGEDFVKLASELSEDSDSAVKGGELGYISEGKTNSLEFEKAIFALKIGEISNVVETPFGFHIIFAEDRKEKRVASFEEAKAYISNFLTEDHKKQNVRDFIEKLTKDVKLEVITENSNNPK